MVEPMRFTTIKTSLKCLARKTGELEGITMAGKEKIKIEYRKGDATKPDVELLPCAIIHIVNDVGAWGRGFVLAINKTFGLDCKEWYLEWASGKLDNDVKFSLGKIQVVRVRDDIAVINMVGQHGIGLDRNGRPPIRYDALESCLDKVAKYIKKYEEEWTVVAPKIGSGLAGGSWDIIEKIIEDKLCSQGIKVIIYSPFSQENPKIFSLGDELAPSPSS